MNRNVLESNYLKIIVSSDFNELESQEEPELKRDIAEDDTDFIEVPKELVSHSFMLNPIRLAIMKTLSDSIKYPSADLRSKLGISWGKFTPHVNQLLKKGFIATEDEFIENSPRKILILEEPGRQQFDTLQGILKDLFN